MLPLQRAEEALWNGSAKEEGKENEDGGERSGGEVGGSENKQSDRWSGREERIGGDGRNGGADEGSVGHCAGVRRDLGGVERSEGIIGGHGI